MLIHHAETRRPLLHPVIPVFKTSSPCVTEIASVQFPQHLTVHFLENNPAFMSVLSNTIGAVIAHMVAKISSPTVKNKGVSNASFLRIVENTFHPVKLE